jgi:hypothetical protein
MRVTFAKTSEDGVDVDLAVSGGRPVRVTVVIEDEKGSVLVF